MRRGNYWSSSSSSASDDSWDAFSSFSCNRGEHSWTETGRCPRGPNCKDEMLKESVIAENRLPDHEGGDGLQKKHLQRGSTHHLHTLILTPQSSHLSYFPSSNRYKITLTNHLLDFALPLKLSVRPDRFLCL
ncbi:unnamed protein product [Pleuronectes platessa]|uniref:Uncharacterized protein n=1 Tax=Pleuronectes platessa TaxID=8262 RepID=A0A9N7YPV9_PLEPL|nr:unnamed protein product [Pleuronectes platessa]